MNKGKGVQVNKVGNGSWNKYNYALACGPYELKHIEEREASHNRKFSGLQPFQKLNHLATLSNILPCLWGRPHGGQPQAAQGNEEKGLELISWERVLE